jgi:D-alanyl-D-alanine carboxypeptidase (penicillin-binding protein 5/6)
MKVTVTYDGPIKAPIAAGQELGKLVVTAPDADTKEFPLVAGRAVDKLGAFGRVGAAVSYLVFGAAQ